MSRPPLVIPSVPLHVHLPQDLMSKLTLHLWSQSEQRIPKGAFQRLFVELLTDYLAKLEKPDAPHS